MLKPSKWSTSESNLHDTDWIYRTFGDYYEGPCTQYHDYMTRWRPLEETPEDNGQRIEIAFADSAIGRPPMSSRIEEYCGFQFRDRYWRPVSDVPPLT